MQTEFEQDFETLKVKFNKFIYFYTLGKNKNKKKKDELIFKKVSKEKANQLYKMILELKEAIELYLKTYNSKNITVLNSMLDEMKLNSILQDNLTDQKELF